MRIAQEVGDRILALVVALDVHVRQYRVGGLLHNDDGDMSGAQQLALTAVGVAIIAGVLYPALEGGLRGVVNSMLNALRGVNGGGGSVEV
jgi:hypothetical protein